MSERELRVEAPLAASHARLLELLRDRAFERREVTLASGRPSSFYIDTKQVTLSAEGHFLVGQLVRSLIERRAPDAEAVGGMSIGADPIASATSLVSYLAGRPLAAFYVRKEPKRHGTEQWVEGLKNLRAGMPVVIVEDVVTTGGSTLRAIERARGAGLRVVRVIALVDRDEGGREAIEREAPLDALYHRRDFEP
jgi:orotate phosphoribosyltransferase